MIRFSKEIFFLCILFIFQSGKATLLTHATPSSKFSIIGKDTVCLGTPYLYTLDGKKIEQVKVKWEVTSGEVLIDSMENEDDQHQHLEFAAPAY